MSGLAKFKNDEIVLRHARANFVGDFRRAHLRLQIVGRDFGRRYEFAVFARECALDSSVKEIGDVRVFFRFGDA